MSNAISSTTALIQNYAQSSSQAHAQEVAQLTMLKKSQDIQAQSILPLLDAVVQNSPKPAASTGSVGSVVDVRA